MNMASEEEERTEQERMVGLLSKTSIKLELRRTREKIGKGGHVGTVDCGYDLRSRKFSRLDGPSAFFEERNGRCKDPADTRAAGYLHDR
jgi:hypothetical protein